MNVGDSMQDKLEKLLLQINFDKENYHYFNEGEILKIVGNKEKTSYKFYINIKTNIPYMIFKEFYKSIKNGFKEIENIQLVLSVSSINKELINEYYQEFINLYSKKSPLIGTFKDFKTEFNEKLIINLNNKAEEIKFNSIVDNLKKDFHLVGYNFDIKLNIENKIDNEVMEEIKKDLEVKNYVEKVVPPKEMVEADYKKKFFTREKREPLVLDKENQEIVIGRKIEDPIIRLDTVFEQGKFITIEAKIFDLEVRETKTDLKIITLKLTDLTDSIYAKIFVNDEEEFKFIVKGLKKGNWYKIRGNTKDDKYSNEVTLQIKDINTSDKKEEEILDDAPVKRVELHTHTKMSQMDGVVDVRDLVSQAAKWGHKAVAVTDHNGIQGFVEAYHFVRDYNKKLKEGQEPFKVIYGTELTMIDDTIKIVVRPTNQHLLTTTFVVFDTETTGFNAGGSDSMIEIGAVKICGGEIVDRFDELINPNKILNPKITELTNITDQMLEDKESEEVVTKKFMEWVGDLPMVAHNAKFDISFLEMAFKKYNLGEFKNTVIDTLELSRTLDNNFARHSLSALVKRYNVVFDEDGHHRADYDSEATALVFHQMLTKLDSRNLETIDSLDDLVSKDEIHKYGRPFHINILAVNKIGLKNLFKVISFANTTYLYKTPRILRSKLEELREGLLIGSGCYQSEVFQEASTKTDEELTNIISFYDYVEVQPIEVYDHLLQTGSFSSKGELLDHIKKIIRVSDESGTTVVATGDVHQLKRTDKIYRQIISNQKVPGGGRHPLAKKDIKEIPSQHFRTTREMLDDFEFLGAEKAYEIVVENTNAIAEKIEIIEVIIETGGIPFSPKIENSVEIVNKLVYDKAESWYGNPLPTIIKERIEQELKGIIGGGFDVIYLIAQKLVKKSNDEGYLVGSRGSVGSSFVATMMGITEVNPLSAHYRCPNCKNSVFEDSEGNSLGATYSSGFDLPDMKCPKCNENMIKDGQDMPFATFLGFNADKVPDIDLNFSDLNQSAAHEYTKELFGIDNVYRAGTIGTVADKTAFGYVKGFCEDNNIVMRTAEIERLAQGCTGVKRTTGQHPGGIVVIPEYMDVFDFTPFQFPADDSSSAWRTTHFDYHAIDEDVLKLDILGHSDPTQLRMIQDFSGHDVTKVPLDDKETMAIFLSPEPLGITKEQIMNETGTLGIPEFGTPFTIGMLIDTKPTSFSELIKISGLSHGTDVWLGNAQELIKNKIVPFKEVIGCRDDIMVYLMYHGVEPIKAFKIMEFVRKGRASKDPETWTGFAEIMKEANIPEWFINSCFKIKYMFPKAHAAAYVISAFRIAYYKVHHPVWYYASWFSSKATDFDIEAMIKGYDAIKNKMIEINNLGYDATNKDSAVLETLKLALEATARGMVFANVDLYKSQSSTFDVKDEVTMYPPFSSIDGLGDTVAKNIVEERNKKEFLSIEDLQKRCKISSTLLDKMRMMGMFEGMDESSQLSLF